MYEQYGMNLSEELSEKARHLDGISPYAIILISCRDSLSFQ